ncbi:phage holin family protein [Aeromonas tecta]|uniref:phage holin family protein n=1 Tax=Aeromonas tecta TaxID=324617 RepID=UPI0009F8F716|nr:phage holin family protein [Aeromonas tecta]
MSRLDDELERLAKISEQQLATRIHAARIAGTFLLVMFFDRRGGEYKALPAWLAWLFCVASGSVPIRLLVGGVPIPDLSSVVLAAFLLCALFKTRGSVHHLLPYRRSSVTTNRTSSTRDLCRKIQP